MAVELPLGTPRLTELRRPRKSTKAVENEGDEKDARSAELGALADDLVRKDLRISGRDPPGHRSPNLNGRALRLNVHDVTVLGNDDFVHPSFASEVRVAHEMVKRAMNGNECAWPSELESFAAAPLDGRDRSHGRGGPCCA